MFLVPLLVLAAMALVVLLAIVLTGAVVGGSLGAALGGVLPWVWARPTTGKGQASTNALCQVLQTTIGIVGGGLLGGLAGVALAVAFILLLLAFG
jgi:hypothetical protein